MADHTPAYNLDDARRAFPISERWAYLNHASISPVPLPAQQALIAASERMAVEPLAYFSGAESVFDRFPAAVAQHINAARPVEIAPLPSTSAGLNSVAQAIQWQAGDNVVLCDVEFPSNVYPWLVLERTHGVEIRFAPAYQGGADLETLAPLVDDRTRVLAVSAVQFLTGHRTDLAALGAFCRERDTLFVVDAIQAAGHMPIDVQGLGIDVLACGGQKSLMAPPGQGFLYVREAAAETMQPAFVGPTSVQGWDHWLNYDLTPSEGAFRFGLGTVNILGMIALVESLRFLNGLGLEHIDAWTRHLSQIAIEDLTARGWHVITPTDPVRHGPIVTFRVDAPGKPGVPGSPGDLAAADARANALVDHLKAHHIQVMKHWDARKVPHLRISTHCYNTEEEVRRVGATLEEYVS
ncbi:MAG: aminotransferase class V-fold PLP-dependent enzyme [Anaerolineae bacterium]|nr:aminotransferase class V-fold PLP-dependent enzyme [Anaerolineae bacterium]